MRIIKAISNGELRLRLNVRTVTYLEVIHPKQISCTVLPQGLITIRLENRSNNQIWTHTVSRSEESVTTSGYGKANATKTQRKTCLFDKTNKAKRKSRQTGVDAVNSY